MDRWCGLIVFLLSVMLGTGGCASLGGGGGLTPRDHILMGWELADRGDLDRAIAHWKKAARLQDDLADVHDHLAFAYLRKGMMGKAAKEWKKAIRMDETFNCHKVVAARKAMIDAARKRMGEGFAVKMNISDLLSDEDGKEGSIHFYPEPIRRDLGNGRWGDLRDVKVYLADGESSIYQVFGLMDSDRSLTGLIESDYEGAIVLESPDFVVPCSHTQFLNNEIPPEPLGLTGLDLYRDDVLGIEIRYPKNWFVKPLVEDGRVTRLYLSREKILVTGQDIYSVGVSIPASVLSSQGVDDRFFDENIEKLRIRLLEKGRDIVDSKDLSIGGLRARLFEVVTPRITPTGVLPHPLRMYHLFILKAPEEIWWAHFEAPDAEFELYRHAFDKMIRSLRLSAGGSPF